jgi:hypothetical protein
MLHHFEGEYGLIEALTATSKRLPELLPIHFCIKSFIEQRFQHVEAKIYGSFPIEMPQFWFILRRHQFTQ